jgi:signal transduction histidine kinase
MMNLQQFILGSEVIETESQKRKIILGAYLILIYIGVDLFFFSVNLFNPEGEPVSLFAGFLISVLCLILLRWKKVNIAIFLHLIRCNGFAFYFSYIDLDPIQTGSFLYFIPSSLGAVAVFGYQERWMGIGFTITSFVLFLIAIFKPAEFSPDQAHFYLIVSFSIVLIIGLLIIIFFDRMVTSSERTLVEKNKELIKANQELDRFVYSASHDLRSPLSSIAGLIELSKRDPPGTSEYLNLMKDRVQVMDKFINDIIDYSRNSRVSAIREKINLFNLIQEVIDLTRYTYGGNHPQVNVLVEKELTVLSDPSRLRVVLNNLLSNSIKYADPDKDELVITITASLMTNAFTFSVEDNGLGIPEDQKDKIFNMFYRASERATGSGLGLYIVKESLETLNGSVRYQSTVGKGSTFTVTIPMEQV